VRVQPDRIRELCARLDEVRVLVLGDFALDVYWELDEGAPERSLETGLEVQRVRRARATPGGAANVAANLSALEVGRVSALGLVGADGWGLELRAALRALDVDVSGLSVRQADWQTQVFAKPELAGQELARFDFGSLDVLEDAVADELVAELASALPQHDVCILNQQVAAGVCSERLLAGLRALEPEAASAFYVIDSRQRARSFPPGVLKLNEAELCQLDEGASSSLHERASAWSLESGRPLYVTRGVDGALLADADVVHELPAVPREGPLDTVGAGDSFVAALAASLAAGATPVEAGLIANGAAALSVTQLGTTGCARRDELRGLLEQHA